MNEESSQSQSYDERLRSLLQASLLLNSTVDLSDILHTLNLLATRFTGAERATLYLMDRGGEYLVSEVVQGEGIGEIRLGLGQGIAGEVARTGQIIRVDDVALDGRFDPSTDAESGFTTRSLLAVPIRDRRGHTLGVLQAINRQPEGSSFDAADDAYLSTLAAHAAVAIQNAQAFAALREERAELAEENARLRSGPKRDLTRPIGSHPSFLAVLETIETAAGSDATVLLRGESGTGKGVLARYLHESSGRAKSPFAQINCAAIPDNLLEAELFGIERGVATGVEARKGRFEVANGGSCFLDEIGDMGAAAQAKILKAVEERVVERVGGRQSIPFDVRLIAATHRHLEKLIEAGDFRADLYYRLNVVSVRVPALRERGEDVLELAEAFLERAAQSGSRGAMEFARETQDLLLGYAWPGNVRELENVVQRCVVLTRGDLITPDTLPPEVGGATSGVKSSPLPTGGGESRLDAGSQDLRAALANYERALLKRAMDEAAGTQANAAAALGISESNLRYKLKKHGL